MNPRFSDSSVYSDESTREAGRGLTTTELSVPTDPQPADDQEKGRKPQEPTSRDPIVDKFKPNSSGRLHGDHMGGKKADLPHPHNSKGPDEGRPRIFGAVKQGASYASDRVVFIEEVFAPVRELETSEIISLESKPKPSPSPPNPPFRLLEKHANLASKASSVSFTKQEEEVVRQSHKDQAPDSEKQRQAGGIVVGPPSIHHSDPSQRSSTPSFRIEMAPSLSTATYKNSDALVQAGTLGLDQDQVSGLSSAPASMHNAPLPPTSAMDLDEQLTVLTDKLKELQLRYAAVNKSIHEITEREVPIHPTASAQVELERQKLKALRDELGDIQKQELDFGLQLTKAWKTLDLVPQYVSLVSPLSRGITS